jgi:hypothetical protein
MFTITIFVLLLHIFFSHTSILCKLVETVGFALLLLAYNYDIFLFNFTTLYCIIDLNAYVGFLSVAFFAGPFSGQLMQYGTLLAFLYGSTLMPIHASYYFSLLKSGQLSS